MDAQMAGRSVLDLSKKIVASVGDENDAHENEKRLSGQELLKTY